jgi:dehydrogenase/reductase SDR family protein 12
MIKLFEQFDTPLSAEECFDFVADFSQLCEWDPTISKSTRVSEGLLGVGSKFHIEAKVGPRTIPIDYVITEFEPPSSLVLEGYGSGGFKAIDRIRFTTSSQGTTVEYEAELSFFASDSYFKPVLKKLLTRTGENAVKGLSDCLEGNFVPKTKFTPPHLPVNLLESIGDRLLLPAMAGFSTFGYRLRKKYFPPIDQRLDGRTVVITGASSGIGEAAAFALAELGARLMLVGRSQERLAAICRKLTEHTGRLEFDFIQGDLSEISEIRRICEQMKTKVNSVDVLIHNAGVLERNYHRSNDGHERSFVINLVAPYLLTRSLVDSISLAENARIIFVSSGGMYPVKLNIAALDAAEKNFDGVLAYAQAKRAQVVVAEELAKDLIKKKIVVHAMHPGWVATSGVSTSLPGFFRLTKPILRTPAEGADTIVWLSAAREPAKLTGKFWHDRRRRSTDLIPGTRESTAVRKQLLAYLRSFE